MGMPRFHTQKHIRVHIHIPHNRKGAQRRTLRTQFLGRGAATQEEPHRDLGVQSVLARSEFRGHNYPSAQEGTGMGQKRRQRGHWQHQRRWDGGGRCYE